jgi:DNA-binding LacI/PurR family transcriptional regulator
VRGETRARVLAAMQELGYRPNLAARALVTGRSKTLGVISFDTTLYGPASTLYGIETAARNAGYFVSVATVRQVDRRSIDEAADHLRAQAVDGIVVIAPHTSAADALRGLDSDLPVVAVGGGVGGGAPAVAIDQHAGAARVCQHLLSLGHDTVWHVAGPDDWLEARGRVAGWRDALAAAGREPPPMLAGDWSPRAGYEHGKVLAKRSDVTAVFVANDQMSLGLLRALHERGIRVPDDISVVGFDDIPESGFLLPPLTTVRQDFDEVGRRAMAVLLALLEEEEPGPADPIRPTLVVRDSTAAVSRPMP